MLFQIACGHTMRWPKPGDFPMWGNFWCEDCQGWKRLIAVECREWHVKCDQCRFGRWAGASKSQAVEIANRHARGGHKRIQVDHLVYPGHKKRAETEYAGYRVQLWITDKTPKPRRYSPPDELPFTPPF